MKYCFDDCTCVGITGLVPYRWFHGKLTGGRIDAERLLVDYRDKNGAFLVRESATFTGDYSLSFV